MLASFCRKTAKKLHDAIWASRWEMILSLLSRKWVAKARSGAARRHYGQAYRVKVSQRGTGLRRSSEAFLLLIQ
jgi:hypothetical protein